MDNMIAQESNKSKLQVLLLLTWAFLGLPSSSGSLSQGQKSTCLNSDLNNQYDSGLQQLGKRNPDTFCCPPRKIPFEEFSRHLSKKAIQTVQPNTASKNSFDDSNCMCFDQVGHGEYKTEILYYSYHNTINSDFHYILNRVMDVADENFNLFSFDCLKNMDHDKLSHELRVSKIKVTPLSASYYPYTYHNTITDKDVGSYSDIHWQCNNNKVHFSLDSQEPIGYYQFIDDPKYICSFYLATVSTVNLEDDKSTTFRNSMNDSFKNLYEKVAKTMPGEYKGNEEVWKNAQIKLSDVMTKCENFKNDMKKGFSNSKKFSEYLEDLKQIRTKLNSLKNQIIQDEDEYLKLKQGSSYTDQGKERKSTAAIFSNQELLKKYCSKDTYYRPGTQNVDDLKKLSDKICTNMMDIQTIKKNWYNKKIDHTREYRIQMAKKRAIISQYANTDLQERLDYLFDIMNIHIYNQVLQSFHNTFIDPDRSYITNSLLKNQKVESNSKLNTDEKYQFSAFLYEDDDNFKKIINAASGRHIHWANTNEPTESCILDNIFYYDQVPKFKGGYTYHLEVLADLETYLKKAFETSIESYFENEVNRAKDKSYIADKNFKDKTSFYNWTFRKNFEYFIKSITDYIRSSKYEPRHYIKTNTDDCNNIMGNKPYAAQIDVEYNVTTYRDIYDEKAKAFVCDRRRNEREQVGTVALKESFVFINKSTYSGTNGPQNIKTSQYFIKANILENMMPGTDKESVFQMADFGTKDGIDANSKSSRLSSVDWKSTILNAVIDPPAVQLIDEKNFSTISKAIEGPLKKSDLWGTIKDPAVLSELKGMAFKLSELAKPFLFLLSNGKESRSEVDWLLKDMKNEGYIQKDNKKKLERKTAEANILRQTSQETNSQEENLNDQPKERSLIDFDDSKTKISGLLKKMNGVFSKCLENKIEFVPFDNDSAKNCEALSEDEYNLLKKLPNEIRVFFKDLFEKRRNEKIKIQQKLFWDNTVNKKNATFPEFKQSTYRAYEIETGERYHTHLTSELRTTCFKVRLSMKLSMHTLIYSILGYDGSLLPLANIRYSLEDNTRQGFVRTEVTKDDQKPNELPEPYPQLSLFCLKPDGVKPLSPPTTLKWTPFLNFDCTLFRQYLSDYLEQFKPVSDSGTDKKKFRHFTQIKNSDSKKFLKAFDQKKEIEGILRTYNLTCDNDPPTSHNYYIEQNKEMNFSWGYIYLQKMVYEIRFWIIYLQKGTKTPAPTQSPSGNEMKNLDWILCFAGKFALSESPFSYKSCFRAYPWKSNTNPLVVESHKYQPVLSYYFEVLFMLHYSLKYAITPKLLYDTLSEKKGEIDSTLKILTMLKKEENKGQPGFATDQSVYFLFKIDANMNEKTFPVLFKADFYQSSVTYIRALISTPTNEFELFLEKHPFRGPDVRRKMLDIQATKDNSQSFDEYFSKKQKDYLDKNFIEPLKEKMKSINSKNDNLNEKFLKEYLKINSDEFNCGNFLENTQNFSIVLALVKYFFKTHGYVEVEVTPDAKEIIMSSEAAFEDFRNRHKEQNPKETRTENQRVNDQMQEEGDDDEEDFFGDGEEKESGVTDGKPDPLSDMEQVKKTEQKDFALTNFCLDIMKYLQTTRQWEEKPFNEQTNYKLIFFQHTTNLEIVYLRTFGYDYELLPSFQFFVRTYFFDEEFMLPYLPVSQMAFHVQETVNGLISKLKNYAGIVEQEPAKVSLLTKEKIQEFIDKLNGNCDVLSLSKIESGESVNGLNVVLKYELKPGDQQPRKPVLSVMDCANCNPPCFEFEVWFPLKNEFESSKEEANKEPDLRKRPSATRHRINKESNDEQRQALLHLLGLEIYKLKYGTYPPKEFQGEPCSEKPKTNMD